MSATKVLLFSALLLTTAIGLAATPVAAGPPVGVCTFDKCDDNGQLWIACAVVFGKQVVCVPDPCDDQMCF